MVRAFVSLNVLLLMSISAAAQPSTRIVSGTVTDQYGNPLSGAVVQIENSVLLRVRSYITHGDGKYHFSRLYWDDDYRLKATYDGLKGPVKTLSQFDSADTKVIHLEVRIPGSEPHTSHARRLGGDVQVEPGDHSRSR